jgi:glyoxylase-like metal-dependent hydrolase (beta-lactamase superfamily II)
LVLDPGPDQPAHIDALLRAIGGAKVAAILVTHSHYDHSQAAPHLKTLTGATILAARRRALTIADVKTPALDDGNDLGFVPDEFLEDGAVIEGASCRLETVATPGHASDHLAFALPAQKLLFSGDHVMGWGTTMIAPPDGEMAEYMDSLARLLGRPETFYLPAHGGAIRDAHSYVRALIVHRKMRERAILDGLSDGDASVAELVARIYPRLAEELREAASLSTLAHLDYLVARGLVASEGPTSGDRFYRTVAVAAPPDASG